jgi:hypothetical protein
MVERVVNLQMYLPSLTEGLVDIVSDSSAYKMSATNVTVRLYECGVIYNPHDDGCMDGDVETQASMCRFLHIRLDGKLIFQRRLSVE